MNLGKVPTPDLIAELARRHPPARAQAPPLPLQGAAADAAEYIKAHPGANGSAVAKAIGVGYEGFKSRIVPKLKTRGFWSGRGCFGGYYPPG